MPLKFAQRRESDVPQPTRQGKVNEELEALKGELSRLRAGMVLEIETGSARAIRRTKGLVTRAGNQLGNKFQHWHSGTKVFAKPLQAARRRGRPPRTQR